MSVDYSAAERLSEVAELRRQLREMHNPPLIAELDHNPDPQQSLRSDGGGGSSGGVTDDWKAGVDRQLGQLHADVRGLLRSGIAAAVALAAMIGGLYVRTDGKFEGLTDRIGRIEAQQQRIEGKIDLLLERRGAELPAGRDAT